MLFSVSYRSTHKDDADEIKCPVNQLGLIYKFMQDHPEKRYNIVMKTLDDKAKEQIEIVKSVTENYTIECQQIHTLLSLRELGYNCYARFPVTDWETFNNLMALGVSDIYIDGPLGFSCDEIAAVANHPLIRVSPTVSPSAALASENKTNMTSFFIRPEDIPTYSDTIDVIDFQMTDQDKEDVLFSIYKRGYFVFDLSDLVEQVHFKIQNPAFPKSFGEQRRNCKQHCETPGRTCNLCETQAILASKVMDYFKKSN